MEVFVCDHVGVGRDLEGNRGGYLFAREEICAGEKVLAFGCFRSSFSFLFSC